MREPEHRYVLGKVDYTNSGKRNCEAAITWSLEGGRFSMCAEIWQANKRDIYTGGQCVDSVAAYFPNDKKAQRMVAIWREWHLNDMTAGSPAQESWLKANPLDPKSYAYPKSHYEVASAALRAAGLNPDPGYQHNGKPYSYGSAWLSRELPADVVSEIESWSAPAKAA